LISLGYFEYSFFCFGHPLPPGRVGRRAEPSDLGQYNRGFGVFDKPDGALAAGAALTGQGLSRLRSSNRAKRGLMPVGQRFYERLAGTRTFLLSRQEKSIWWNDSIATTIST
jgi:hypothetical protein